MRVLVADDDVTSRKILKKILKKWGYEVITCSDGVVAWDILHGKNSPRMAILDWMMPGMDGLVVCRAIRQRKEEPYTYIIVLTAKDQKKDIVEALEAGADDFIHKPFDNQELKMRLRAGRRILDLQSELISEREALKYRATHDILTGLPNLALFNDHLMLELAHSRRNGKKVAILYLDLDRFKIINDTLGHKAGDEMLRYVAKRLLAGLREYDTVARLGGDEFVILLPQIVNQDYVTKVAERIIDMLKPPFFIENQELYITTSIGIVNCNSEIEEDNETLLKNADIAMYYAKEQGKNNYQYYTTAMKDKTMERMSLENDLRNALERDELFLHYQPLIDLNTGHIVGMEALIRWQHPSRGLISPVSFIPIAEETGLIMPIGEWVLWNACKQNKIWQEAGYMPIHISVNLSAQQFKQQNLVEIVSSVLDDTRLDPQWLHLEITETDIMKNPDIAIATLSALHNMRIKLSIDDFGTGYSSLSYLKRLPVDILKIDRSFVSDITYNQDDAEIIKTIIAMAHTLKLGVIAEGVETVEQLDFLRRHNCDEAQGFFFSKPVGAKEVKRFLSMDKAFFMRTVPVLTTLSNDIQPTH